jgi:glycosyltransferase involved in cell wall biosynthesis
MTDKKPLISVIIPVYNAERYLAEAVESVLAQTYRPLEVIVIDDGSTDSSAAIIKKYALLVTYFYQPNAGSSAARNRGVRFSKGEYLAFLDADDLWVEDKLELQMRAFQQNPQTEAVFCHVRQFYSPDLSAELRARIVCHPSPMPGYLTGMMLIRKEAFLRYGEFESQWDIGEDLNWMVRAQDMGIKKILLPETLLLRRLHENNQGILLKDRHNQLTHILKASLDRRRQAAAQEEGGSKGTPEQP